MTVETYKVSAFEKEKKSIWSTKTFLYDLLEASGIEE